MTTAIRFRGSMTLPVIEIAAGGCRQPGIDAIIDMSAMVAPVVPVFKGIAQMHTRNAVHFCQDIGRCMKEDKRGWFVLLPMALILEVTV